MKFRKGGTDGRPQSGYTIALDTPADRDTAAKMIAAMEHWSKVGGDVIDNVGDGIYMLETRYCFLTITGYGEDDEPIEDSHYGPTPWDAILAAKKASEG